MRRFSTVFVAPLFLGGLALVGMTAPLAHAAPDPWKPMDAPKSATPREVQLGDEAAKEFEGSARITLWKDDTPEHKAMIEKLNGMAQELGKVSARPGIKYQVKVVDDTTINAFTLPDGRIYIYRGLIEALGSDDELAAVIAHEIGHNARMHALRGMAKQRKLSYANLAAMLAMLAGGAGANAGAFSQYLLVGIMNGYSIEYEKEADVAGMQELVKTRYNPSAMVTVMQRFASQEARGPQVEMGIFQDHPSSPERVQAAMDGLKRLGIAYTPRDVKGSIQAQATVTDGRAQVKMGSLVLIELAADGNTAADAKTRSETAAASINDLIRGNLMLTDLSTQTDDKGTLLTAKGQIIARCTPRDAALHNLTPQATVQKWMGAFQTMFWREQLSGKMG